MISASRWYLGRSSLAGVAIGPLWPFDPDREIGMRGMVRRKTDTPIGAAYRAHRARRRRIARASRAANR